MFAWEHPLNDRMKSNTESETRERPLASVNQSDIYRSLFIRVISVFTAR